MHQTTAPRQSKNARPLVGVVPAVGTGHVTQRPARFHDRRTARNRTRSNQNRNALRDW